MRSALLGDGGQDATDSSSASSSHLGEDGGSDSGVSLYCASSPAPVTRRTLSLLLLVLSVVSLVAVCLVIALWRESSSAPSSPPSPPVPSSSSVLGSAITAPMLWRHLNALQSIADTSGSRAIGSPGFNLTLAYITQTLRNETSLTVAEQPFSTQAWFLSEPRLHWAVDGLVSYYDYQRDYHVLTYSGSVTADNASVFSLPNGGCRQADWLGFTAGGVALLSAANCSSAAKASLAAAQGAVAVLIFQDRTTRTLLPGGVYANTAIGAFLLPYTVGIALAETVLGRPAGAVTASLHLNTTTSVTGVANVCAWAADFGDPTRTVISGAHADSVPAGAGINDNGSGVALNLALALELSRLVQTGDWQPFPNRVKFCWWAAEEVGLVGSQWFVQQAVLQGLKGDNGTVGERIPQDVQAYLNYDIVGSPNYVFGVWDGESFRSPTNLTWRSMNGSLATTRLFTGYFNRSGLTYTSRPLDNRSDYKPFHDAGVAAGGATSGREDLKTLEERNRYARILGPGHGGIPGVQFDPCYHQRCDMVFGVNPQSILNLTHAAGSVLETLARNTDLLTFLQYPVGSRGEDIPLLTEAEKAARMQQLQASFRSSTEAFLNRA